MFETSNLLSDEVEGRHSAAISQSFEEAFARMPRPYLSKALLL